MSVHPVEFNEDTQTYRMIHDELGHEFDMLLADIQFTTGINETEFQSATIPCLVCDSSSTHPVGGGAAPLEIQALFTRLIGDKGCPCGVLISGKATGLNKSHAKLHCEQQDYPGRWQLDGVTVT